MKFLKCQADSSPCLPHAGRSVLTGLHLVGLTACANSHLRFCFSHNLLEDVDLSSEQPNAFAVSLSHRCVLYLIAMSRFRQWETATDCWIDRGFGGQCLAESSHVHDGQVI